MRVFGYGLINRMFGSKKGTLEGEWRKQNNRTFIRRDSGNWDGWDV
jgi:hypothetical protein